MAAIGGLLAGKARRTEVAARRRSASLETLLAGMAHELRNASQQVRNAHSVIGKLARQAMDGTNAEEASSHGGSETRLRKMNAISQRALDRISKVIQGLQQYSRHRMQVPWSDQDFDDLVDRQVRMVVETEMKEVELDLALNSGARIHGPIEELRQMVLNLVENALQAVSPGGLVRVETVALAGKVRFTVKDNGYGIPPGLQDRIFDPFFTTKAPGQGMGLGLALCKRTVTDMGGTVNLKSRKNVGTEMIVELPTAEVGVNAVTNG
jgi:signal transduction histidine kinase